MPTSLSRSAAISAGATATITPAASDYSNPGQELPDTPLVDCDHATHCGPPRSTVHVAVVGVHASGVERSLEAIVGAAQQTTVKGAIVGCYRMRVRAIAGPGDDGAHRHTHVLWRECIVHDLDLGRSRGRLADNRRRDGRSRLGCERWLDLRHGCWRRCSSRLRSGEWDASHELGVLICRLHTALALHWRDLLVAIQVDTPNRLLRHCQDAQHGV